MKRWPQLFLALLFAALGCVSSAFAQTQFYVSTAGNDSNNGTSTGTAWKTIQHAMNVATPGSTVNIMAGTYHEELVMNVSGTAGNYITFQPYNFSVPAGGCAGFTGVTCGGDEVILDYSYLGTNTSQTPAVHISGRQYLRIQGITFQNFTCTGGLQQFLIIDSGASYVEFNYDRLLNLKNVYGARDGTAALHAIRTFQSTNIQFLGIEEGNIVTNMSEALTADDNSSVLVQDSYIHDTDAEAITTWRGSTISMRHNLCEYNGIVRATGANYYANYITVTLYIDGGGPDVIERNIVDHGQNGIEAMSETNPLQPATHDITVRNNVVEHITGNAITIGTWYSNTDGSDNYNINIWNNILYANKVGVLIRPMNSATVFWENNIFANNTTNYANPLGWNPGTTGYNVYYGGNTGPGSNNLTSDPQFNNTLTRDFSVKSTSPVINAGDPSSSTAIVGAVDLVGDARIQGGRIDIGAHEYGGIQVPAPPTHLTITVH